MIFLTEIHHFLNELSDNGRANIFNWSPSEAQLLSFQTYQSQWVNQ